MICFLLLKYFNGFLKFYLLIYYYGNILIFNKTLFLESNYSLLSQSTYILNITPKKMVCYENGFPMT